MPRGGPRPGSGRPRGDRMDPVRASIRAAVRKQLVQLVENGENPLSFLISLVKDETVDLPIRMYAVETLLPYT